MAKTRLDLQTFLESLLGSRNVYFQPPASIRMKYPAIVYSISDIEDKPADDLKYVQHTAYKITVIDEDPDSEVSKSISKLPLSSFDTFFTMENLNHFVYTLYY